MLGFQEILNQSGSPENPYAAKKPESLQPRLLKQLLLFSTTILVFSALFMQFIMTLQTAFLLQRYSISFIYRLFGISFSSVSAVKWSEARIFLVFGLTVLLFFVAGLLILFFLKKQRQLIWKFKLVLAWIGFLLVHSLPMAMLTGTFFFDGFGIAYTWLFDSMWMRAGVSLLALIVVLFFRPFWMEIFLKAVFSTSFLSDNNTRKIFIKYAFVLPWIFGLVLLFPFFYLHHGWFWLVSYLSLGFVVLPVFGNNIPMQKILILKNDKKIFHFKYPLPLFLGILILLWFADFISKTNF